MKSKLDWICENYPKGYDDGLTEEQAKDLCVEMWNEMAENEYRDKKDSKLIDILKPDCTCFACEYYSSKNKYDRVLGLIDDPIVNWACSGCAFLKFRGCLVPKSPYKKMGR